MFTFVFMQAEGEPVPNVRWYVDRIIEDAVFQNREEEVEILKFSNVKSSEEANYNHPVDSNPMQAMSSSPSYVTEATSSSDIYSYQKGMEFFQL